MACLQMLLFPPAPDQDVCLAGPGVLLRPWRPTDVEWLGATGPTSLPLKRRPQSSGTLELFARAGWPEGRSLVVVDRESAIPVGSLTVRVIGERGLITVHCPRPLAAQAVTLAGWYACQFWGVQRVRVAGDRPRSARGGTAAAIAVRAGATGDGCGPFAAAVPCTESQGRSGRPCLCEACDRRRARSARGRMAG